MSGSESEHTRRAHREVIRSETAAQCWAQARPRFRGAPRCAARLASGGARGTRRPAAERNAAQRAGGECSPWSPYAWPPPAPCGPPSPPHRSTSPSPAKARERAIKRSKRAGRGVARKQQGTPWGASWWPASAFRVIHVHRVHRRVSELNCSAGFSIQIGNGKEIGLRKRSFSLVSLSARTDHELASDSRTRLVTRESDRRKGREDS
jgi:hypothetical protein